MQHVPTHSGGELEGQMAKYDECEFPRTRVRHRQGVTNGNSDYASDILRVLSIGRLEREIERERERERERESERESEGEREQTVQRGRRISRVHSVDGNIDPCEYKDENTKIIGVAEETIVSTYCSC